MTNELKAILFLHILAAMALVGGLLGVLILFQRARGAADDSRARDAANDAIALNRWLVTAGGGLAGIIGFLLMIRYDQEGIFDLGKQVWLHTAILLWLVVMGLSGFFGARARRAMSAGDGTALRTALSDSLLTILVWANAVVAVVIVYLMVFQPFVSD